MQWHTDHHSGDTINRINLAGRALFDFTIMQFVYIELFFTILFSLAILTYLSWQVALLSFVIAALTVLFIGRFDKHLVVLYRNMNEVEHKVSATLFDYISNIKTIITLRLAQKTQDELDAHIDKGYKPTMHAETWVNAWKWFTVSCCMVIQEITVVFYYIWLQLSQSQNVLIGNVAAVFQYAKMLNQSFANIAREYQSILQWSTHMEAVKDISLPTNPEDSLANISNWQKIKISNLNFEYEPGKQTLCDIGLDFQKGDKIAFVGESGSGKSSLMAILRGLYDPDSVRFMLDGKEFETLSPTFGTTTLIPQEPEVFENTIRFNITVGIEHAEEELIEATIRELHEELGAAVKAEDVVFIGAITEDWTDHTEIVHVHFWHDKDGTITGCYEAEAREYDTVQQALEHPKIMDYAVWALKQCQKRGYLRK